MIFFSSLRSTKHLSNNLTGRTVKHCTIKWKKKGFFEAKTLFVSFKRILLSRRSVAHGLIFAPDWKRQQKKERIKSLS
jgi:hypothetical protein